MKRFWWWMAIVSGLNFLLSFGAAMYYGWAKDYPHGCYELLIAGFALYWTDFFLEKCE